MDDAERVRAYLSGYDDGARQLMKTLMSVPDQHWRAVVDFLADRHGVNGQPATSQASEPPHP